MSKKELKEKIKELEKKIRKLEKQIETAENSPEWQILPLFGNNDDNEVEVKISLKKRKVKKDAN